MVYPHKWSCIRQLQVERRTAKARRPKTDVLPLDHATNLLTSGPKRIMRKIAVKMEILSRDTAGRRLRFYLSRGSTTAEASPAAPIQQVPTGEPPGNVMYRRWQWMYCSVKLPRWAHSGSCLLVICMLQSFITLALINRRINWNPASQTLDPLNYMHSHLTVPNTFGSDVHVHLIFLHPLQSQVHQLQANWIDCSQLGSALKKYPLLE